jgi:hypothetical protein
VGVTIDEVWVQTNQRQQFLHPLAHRFFTLAQLVDTNWLSDDITDGHTGVE